MSVSPEQKAPLNLQKLSASGDPPFPRCSGTLTVGGGG